MSPTSSSKLIAYLFLIFTSADVLFGRFPSIAAEPGKAERIPSKTAEKSRTTEAAADDDASDEIKIQLIEPSGKARQFRVTGISDERESFLRRLAAPVDNPVESAKRIAKLAMVFSIHVKPPQDKPGNRKTIQASVPMLGDYRWEKRLTFTPRFPLEAGVAYVAVYRDDGAQPANVVRREFSIPREPLGEPVEVTHVFPSGDVIPENLLKLYVHFSAPVGQGRSYRRMHLLDEEGREIELPFLELGEELWDPSGTRLTVLFDPGRIKRGLKPREDEGPVFEEGRKYTFVIDRDWPDVAGRPLARGYRRSFKAVAPDDKQPDPARWKIDAPAADGRDPLTVTFDEPLDHAMLKRVVRVQDEQGAPVRGAVEVLKHETHWRFKPQAAWKPGRYRLVVETTLEDRAGNSIGRPFEVDVERRIGRRVEKDEVSIPFRIEAG